MMSARVESQTRVIKKGSKTLSCFATALGVMTLASACPQALATKLNAKPLPRFSTFDRPAKDFSGQGSGNADPMPPSLWANRKPDYRDEQKRQKEEEAQKAQAEVQKAEKAKQEQVRAIKALQQEAINANNTAVGFGRVGRWAEAVSQHEKACKIDPGNEEFKRNLSAAYCKYGEQRLKQGDASGAAHLFRKSLGAASNNALAGQGLSQAIKKMGLDPALADNRIGLGDQLAAGGDLTGATLEYTLAMQLDPCAKTYTKMGDMSVRFGQIPNAVSWYRQAIVKDAGYGPAHRGMGFAYMMLKDFTSAASALRKAVIASGDDSAAGQALVEIWRKQVATQPTLAENHLGLGTALQLTGDLDGAESEYMKVEQLDRQNPQLTPARNSLAKARKHREAEKHREAAETFYGQGLKREALSELAQAAMMEPNNARYQFQMGEFLEGAGDYQNALAAYRKSVLIDPKNEEGARRMRELMSQFGQGQNQPRPQQQAPSPESEKARPQLQRTVQQPPPQAQITAPRAPQNQPGNSANQQIYQKNMFEGGGAAQAGEPAPFTGSFATHDDRREGETTGDTGRRDMVERGGEAPNSTPPRAAAKSENPILQQVAALEMRGDFNGAVEILKNALPNNLQNPDIHHRLGLDLVNLGQTSEALSELRIASALDPGNRTYAEDLARVLKIHQRSLTGENK